MPDRNESRPEKAAPEAAKSFGGDYPQYSDTTDILALASHEWHIFMDGYESGYSAGIERGRQIADAEAAARHRAAAQAVLGVALMPRRDAAADRRRAERSRAYWARRRGEGGAA